MRTFYLRNILLLMMVVGVGDAWGQNCGSATSMSLVRIDNSTAVAITAPSTTGALSTGNSSICVGELNRYRFSITDIAGDAVVTYTYGTNIIQSGTGCSSTVACGQNSIEFYLVPGVVTGQPLTATVVGTTPACSLVYTITLNPTALMPTVVVTNANGTNQAGTSTTGGSLTSNSIGCAASNIELSSSCTNCAGGYTWQGGSTTNPYTITALSTTNNVVELTAVSGDGCIIKNIHTVNIKTVPTLNSVTVSDICQNLTTTASVTCTNFASLTGITNLAYNWGFTGTSSQSTIISSLTLSNTWSTTNINTSGTNSMSVFAVATYNQVSDITCTSVTSSDNFEVFPIPNFVATAEGLETGAEICLGQPVNLNYTPASAITISTTANSGNGGASWTGTNAFTNVSTSASTSNTPSAAATIDYTLVITDNNGCTNTDAVSVLVKPVLNLLPQVRITGTSTPITTACIGDIVDVVFTNSFSGQTGETDGNNWNWGSSPCTVPNTTARTVSACTLNTGGAQTWSGTFVNQNTCISNFSIPLTVNTNPVVSITGPTTKQCSNTQITLTANDGTNNWSGTNITAWQLGSGTPEATGTNPFQPTVLNNGGGDQTLNYNVTVTNASGCQTVQTFPVVVAPGFTVSLPPNTTACQNNDVVVTPSFIGGTPPFSFNWTLPAPPATGESYTIENATLGTYNFTVQVSDASTSGCSQTVSQTITVINCGSVTIQKTLPAIASDRVCLGDFVLLEANCTGCVTEPAGQPLVYNWTTGGANSPTLSFNVNNLTPETMNIGVNVGYYKTTVSTGGFSTTFLEPIGSANITLYVSKPNIVINSDTAICDSQPFSLIATCANCSNNLSYSWQELISASTVQNIGPVSNGTNTLESSLNISQNLNFRVTVTDVYGCRSTDNVFVTYKPLPITTIDQGVNAQYCPTSSVLLSTTTQNCQNCTYFWSTGQISSSISVNQDNVFSVTTTNNGCSEVDNITVTKYPIPEPIIGNSAGTPLSNQSSPNNILYLCGNPSSLEVIASSCTGCGFNWNTGATSPDITVSGEGGFFVQAIDGNGCIGYSGPVFVINSTSGQNSIASASPAQVCNGNPAVLEVEPCNSCSYTWYNNTAPNTALSPIGRTYATTVSGNYFVRTTNANGCVYNSNLVNISAVTVSVPPINSSTDTICGSITNFPASPVTLYTVYDATFKYQWYRNGLPVSAATSEQFTINLAGDYYVAVEYPNGCTVYSPVKTIVENLFSPNIATPSSLVICSNDSIVLSTPTGVGYSYQWYRNGNILSGENFSNYAATTEGVYYVLITNNHGCTRLTSSISLTESSNVVNIDANPNYTEICPGEMAVMQVSLCPNCRYQWFNAATGTPISGAPVTSNFQFSVTATGSYYARVNDDDCFAFSDTIQVVALPVITPSINTNANIVCEGVTPTIFTQGCVGCTYTWKRDNNIVFGALNDTFLIVSNVSDAGVYTLEVTYPNGCTGFSNAITITDGSYLLDITAADVIICNNDNELLSSTAALPAICNLGCNYQWFRNNIAIPSSNTQNYTANIGGNFKLRMTDSRGCIEESNIIPLTEVNLIPNISSTSTVICGNDAILLSYPDSAACTGCTYAWQEGGSPAIFGTITNPSYVTDIGAAAVGVYGLEVTKLGCTALSNLISLNQIAGLSIPVASTDMNICNGDTTTIYRVGGGCVDCQFQWLLDSLPILAATTPSLTVSNPGNYNLQMTIGATGCRDTSMVISLLPVQSPIDSFSLSAALYTPLTNTGPQVNLQNAVFPAGIAQASSNDFFFSQPFNAALGPNSGLSGPNNDTLNPGIAGSGYHRIYYQFDTMGCSFVYDDILFVFGEPNVNVVNENFNAPQYEACVSDTIQLQVFNMPFKIDSVYLFDVNNNYQLVDIANSALQDTTYGLDVVWNGTIRIGIPAWAKASFMMVTSAGNVDTFITPFILIHNTELDISGLPGVVCSANPPLTLTGTPAGGYFTAQYHTGGVPAMGTLVTGAFSGSNFNTGAMTRASYGPDMIQNIRVVYNFQNSYTNGITCPQVDTTSIIVEARGVFLDSVKYNPISVSQDRELLSNLVFRVYPYQSQPSWIRNNYNPGSISFNGNFTFPAGNPVDFLPKNAGVGKHAMTYRIHNGVCMNSKTDSIQVIDAPNPIGIPDSMCRSQTFADFGRQVGLYSYFDGPNIAIQPGIFFSDTINIINIYSTTGPNEGLTVLNPALNLEQYNYSPLAVTGNSDTLKMEYWYKKVEYISGVPVDTIMYIVGSIVTPIYIEDTFAVDIIDSIVANVYCEVDQLYLLAGSPSGGIFTLEGGTSAYVGGALLVNNILNPFDVHSPENTNTTYNLTYTKMGAVCQNSDTKQITIPEPLDPSFGTASGKRVFCQTDPIENIVINTIGAFTPVWLVNGITQPQPPVFNPIVLNPGNQLVTHIVTDDIFGCVYTAVDTYRINPLPDLSVIPRLDTAYCTNDPIDSFTVSPNPICAQFVTSGLTMLFEGFDAVAFPWNRANTGPGNTWVRSTVLPYAGTGAAFVNTSNDVEDAWMFTPTLSLITGHTYLVSLFAAAGTCSPPPCFPASFAVRVGQGQTIAAQMSGTTFGDTAIAHTFYQPYTFTYTHTGLSGNYNFSFQCFSGVDARSLTMDDISIVDGSVSGCVLGGTGTMVGPGINYISDSTYAFNPTIIAPGNYNIRYVYTAAATGCTDSIQMPVRVKPHPLPFFTNLDPQYCDNAATVPLVGTPSGGAFSSSGPNLVNTPFWAFDPNTGISNEIVSYTYTDIQTLCTTTVSDTTTVISITDSARISSLNPAGYCFNVDTVMLNVQPVFGTPGVGVFSGMGVRNGANGPMATNFYPDSAVIDGGRYGDFVITYVYPTNSGCFDTTRAIATVHAMPDLSFNFMVPDTSRLPDSICLNADIVQVRVNNRVITGALGQIIYDTLIPIGPFLGGDYVPSLGLQDTLNPRRFGVGWHNIAYTFTDGNGCTTTIRDSFRVDTVPVIRFAGLNANRIYCENEVPSLLLAYPPYYPGSGYLQLTSGLDSIVVDSSFYLINPAVFADTTNPNRRWDIYYTFEDLNFCSSTGTDSFFVRPYPRITLAMPPTFCSGPILEPLMPFVTPQGGVFTDNLVVTGIAQDSLLNLSGTMGPRRITYYYLDTVSTCRNNAFQDITIFNTPDVDFYALGGCVGANINFVSDSLVNNLTPGLDSITLIEWIYGDGNSTVLIPTSATNIPNQSHVYNTNGVYQVSLAITNRGQCTDTVTRQLVISPFVNTYPYLEDFQAGTGDWYQEQPINVPDSLALWQHAQLLGANINDPGNFAWVTRANAPYTYELNERGWVYSPCFDFTNAWRPMIAFDIWRDFLTDIDGAVLEFYDDYSNSWKTVGVTGSGINWYQTDFLVARPGNQANVAEPKGWTGESGNWEKARYKLDNLVGRPFVRFRVAFASDPNTVLEGHEGFAFDSVWIGERGRNVLIEHFSNYYHVNQQGSIMDVIDKKVYDEIYNSVNGRDVSLIQYQTNIQQVDPINALYSVDFDSRVLYYGINANSQIRIDGQTYGNGRSENLSQLNLDFDMLQFPVFDIQIAPLIFAGNTIQISAAATALANLDSADYTMTFAITEDEVSNGRGFPMKSVLRKFIPDASGFPYQRNWITGQSVAESGSWVYNFGNLNPNKIEAVVYIQNNNTKDVLQVATSRDLSIFPPVGTESVEEEAAAREDILGMNLFPNPAANYFNVSFDQPLSDDYQWALIDVLGRVLRNGKATSGTTQMTVDTDRLSEGTYFFVIRNDKAYAQRKVVIGK